MKTIKLLNEGFKKYEARVNEGILDNPLTTEISDKSLAGRVLNTASTAVDNITKNTDASDAANAAATIVPLLADSDNEKEEMCEARSIWPTLEPREYKVILSNKDEHKVYAQSERQAWDEAERLYGREVENVYLNESLNEKYDLVGQDGNAFALMGYTARAMRECGLGSKVKEMQERATSGDYYNLIAVCDEYIQQCNDIKGFEDTDESLNESKSLSKKEVFDFLDTLEGYNDYNQHIEDLMSEFDMTEDEAIEWIDKWLGKSEYIDDQGYDTRTGEDKDANYNAWYVFHPSITEDVQMNEFGQKAWNLNEIISSMNGEGAYFGGWLYIWPDGTDREDANYYFDDEESYKELEDSFIRNYKRYHNGGLYKASPEVEKLAHEWDSKLGLKPIENIK